MNLNEATKVGLDLLQDLIRVESVSGAGGETEAARLLLSYAERFGVSGRIYEPVRGSGSFVATHKGTTSENLLLLSHLDVAPAADSMVWEQPPFSGDLVRGEIWGRGAVDLKGLVAAHFAVMLVLRDTPLPKGLVMSAVSEEESAGSNGIAWLLSHCPDVRACQCALSEGGGWELSLGRRRLVTVQTGEKGVIRAAVKPRRFFEGTGCGFRNLEIAAPPARSAVRLVSLLSGVPEALVGLLPGSALVALGEFGQRLSSHRIDLRSMVSHTCEVIRKSGGLEICCRVAPGVAASQVLDLCCRSLGVDVVGEPHRWVEPAESAISGPNRDLMQAIRYAAGMEVAPIFIPGPSDNHWLREAGMAVYGFFPGPSAQEVMRIHKANERLSVDSFCTGVRILLATAERYCLGRT